MPRNNRRSRRTNRSKPRSGQTANVMKQLVTYQQASTNKMMPLVPDVPRLRIKRDKVHTFIRSYAAPSLVGSTSIDVRGAITTSLSDFPDNSDFTNLFDEYRIVQLVYEFTPLSSSATANYLLTATDPDDGNAPLTANDIRQYDTMMASPPGVAFERVITPKVSVSTYTGAFGGFANASPSLFWLDTSSPTIQHYSLKYYWPFSALTTTSAVYQVTVYGTIQCRHPH